MAREQHTEDLRNVREGDGVTITTTDVTTFDARCTDMEVQRADERSGYVRVTRIWIFGTPYGEVGATILDGLRSKPDDPDFPKHTELWNTDEEESMGYIETLQIHGDGV
jgi:hypothetical protein